MTIASRVRTGLGSHRALEARGLLRHSAIYWSASLVVAFVNYLYYPVLSRLLPPSSFGETQTIISIFTQAAVFFQVLGLIGVGIITKYADEETRDRLSSELSRAALFLSIVLFMVTVILSSQLRVFFRFTSAAPFLLLAVSLLISVPLAFANAYLQGHKRFGKLSSSNLLASVCKVVFSALLVLLGFQTMGAVGGLVLAQILALGYSLHLGQGIRHFAAGNLKLQIPRVGLIKSELPYAAMVLATSIATNLLLSFDILVVKHYFPPERAGLYTGISIISNIIYFVTGPLAAVLVASVKLSQPAAANARLLLNSLILTGLVGGAALLVFTLEPHLVTSVLLGQRYAAYSGYLRGLSLALFLASVANLLIYYHIGLRHFLVVPAVIAGTILTLILLIRAHATMALVVHDLVIGSAVLLVLVAGLLPVYRKEFA